MVDGLGTPGIAQVLVEHWLLAGRMGLDRPGQHSRETGHGPASGPVSRERLDTVDHAGEGLVLGEEAAALVVRIVKHVCFSYRRYTHPPVILKFNLFRTILGVESRMEGVEIMGRSRSIEEPPDVEDEGDDTEDPVLDALERIAESGERQEALLYSILSCHACSLCNGTGQVSGQGGCDCRKQARAVLRDLAPEDD